MSNAHLLSRITVNPRVFQGQPIIRGMRIKVDNVLALLEQGVREGEILADFPDLEPQDIRACLAYARRSVRNETVAALTLEPVA